MVDGILLKLSTDAAVEAQKRFTRETTSAFESVAKEGSQIDALQKRLDALSAKLREHAASTASNYKSSISAAAAALQSERQQRDEAEKAAAAKKSLSAAQREVSGESSRLGVQTGQLTGLMSKLLSAAGQSGAAKGIGLLGTAVRGLAGALNPLGVVTGIAAGAIISLAVEALTAQTPLEKLQDQAREAQDTFTTMGTAIDRSTAALSKLAGARQVDFSGSSSGLDGELRQMQRLRDAISEAATEINGQNGRTGGFALTIQQLEQLGDALGFGAQYYKDLGDAIHGTTRQQDSALVRLNRLVGIQKVDGVLVADSARIQRELGLAYERTSDSIRARTALIRDAKLSETLTEIGKVGADIGQSVSDERLGAREREAVTRIRNLQSKMDRELSAEERSLADSVIGSAKAYDEQKSALEAAARAKEKEAQDLDRIAKSYAETAKAQKEYLAEKERHAASFKSLLDGYEKEIALLSTSGDERERLRIAFEVQAAAESNLVEITKDEADAIDRLTDRLVTARGIAEREAKARQEAADAERALSDERRRLAQDQERQNALDERRIQILRQLDDEASVLLAVGDDEIAQKRHQVQLNNLLAQTETDAASAAGKSIKAALERVEEAERVNEKMRELRSLGEETFGAIGQGIANAVAGGGGFREMLKNIALDLQRIALQRAIVDQLARLGGQLFGSFGSSAPPSSTSSPSAIGAPPPGAFNMSGGMLPSSSGPSVMAASGVLLDRFQTFNYGGRRITTNEGGAATPEAVFPLTRDSKGRLGLSAPGSAGNVTIYMPSIRSAAEARMARPTIRQMLEQAQRSGSRGIAGRR